MNFLDYLKSQGALSEENLKPPKVHDWVRQFLEAHPIEEQEKELLQEMSRERWVDADQVIEELERAG
ncbi:MAG: hypothetical protein U0793_13615 [Gemmataceae bacterium]